MTVAAAVDVINGARLRGSRIFTCGNGGSGSIASHFAGDLSVNVPFPYEVVCLNDSMTAVTAIANDYDYGAAFSFQLGRFAAPGDVLIVFSSSAASVNIIAAVDTARLKGLHTIGIFGDNTRPVNNRCDVVITPCIADCEINEPIFSAIAHCLVEELRHVRAEP